MDNCRLDKKIYRDHKDPKKIAAIYLNWCNLQRHKGHDVRRDWVESYMRRGPHHHQEYIEPIEHAASICARPITIICSTRLMQEESSSVKESQLHGFILITLLNHFLFSEQRLIWPSSKAQFKGNCSQCNRYKSWHSHWHWRHFKCQYWMAVSQY